MRKRKVALASCVALCLHVSVAYGGFIATVNNAGSSGNSITINIDDPLSVRTFSIDVNTYVSPEVILSAQMKLLASAPNIVRINSGTYGPMWDAQWSLTVPVGPLAPLSAWFGALPLGDPPRLTGSSRLITLNLEVLPTAPKGTYTLNVTSIRVGDADTHQNIGGTAGPPFQLILIPEPATLALAAVGAAAAALRRRRPSLN